MKTGMTLTALAAEIERQANAKKDFLAPTTKLLPFIGAGKPILAIGDNGTKGGEFSISDIAHGQIAEHTGIPKRYYDKMLAEAPELWETNVGTWFRKFPAKRLVRTLDGRTRAFLSDGFRPFDNHDFASAALPVLHDLNLEILAAEITEKRLYIKAVDKRIHLDIPTGHKLGEGHQRFDTLSPVVILSNSEIGFGQLTVDGGIFTGGCTNLALTMTAMKRRHVGGRLGSDDGEVQAYFQDDTRAANDKALWLKVRDHVRGVFDEARFTAEVKKLGRLAEVDLDDPIKVVDFSASRFNFNDGERNSVLKHLIAGGDLTTYGLFNAVTRSAEDADSFDRATELEAIGGEIMSLPAAELKALALAA